MITEWKYGLPDAPGGCAVWALRTVNVNAASGYRSGRLLLPRLGTDRGSRRQNDTNAVYFRPVMQFLQ